MIARYALLAIAIYLVMLLVMAPANWTVLLVTRGSQGTLGLARPSGGFWRGRGRLYLQGHRPVWLGTLSWHIDPWGLVLGRAQAQLALAGPLTLHLTVARSWNRLTVHGLSLAAPASVLASLDTDLRVLAPSGEVRVRARALTLTSRAAFGRAHLVWTAVGTHLSTVKPLGDYRVDARGRGGQIAFMLRTLQGPLSLSGQGTWDTRGVFRFRGLATASGSDPRVLRLVRQVGPRLHAHIHAFVLQAKTPSWPRFFH
ncbi:MAG: type II secretion system protein N [Acidiferrobacteraceae bacterium]